MSRDDGRNNSRHVEAGSSAMPQLCWASEDHAASRKYILVFHLCFHKLLPTHSTKAVCVFAFDTVFAVFHSFSELII